MFEKLLKKLIKRPTEEQLRQEIKEVVEEAIQDETITPEIEGVDVEKAKLAEKELLLKLSEMADANGLFFITPAILKSFMQYAKLNGIPVEGNEDHLIKVFRMEDMRLRQQFNDMVSYYLKFNKEPSWHPGHPIIFNP